MNSPVGGLEHAVRVWPHCAAFLLGVTVASAGDIIGRHQFGGERVSAASCCGLSLAPANVVSGFGHDRMVIKFPDQETSGAPLNWSVQSGAMRHSPQNVGDDGSSGEPPAGRCNGALVFGSCSHAATSHGSATPVRNAVKIATRQPVERRPPPLARPVVSAPVVAEVVAAAPKPATLRKIVLPNPSDSMAMPVARVPRRASVQTPQMQKTIEAKPEIRVAIAPPTRVESSPPLVASPSTPTISASSASGRARRASQKPTKAVVATPNSALPVVFSQPASLLFRP